MDVKHSKVKAGLLASGLGLLKEVEDGFREGFGINDAIFDQLGVVSFLLLSDYLHYTFTFEQIISTADDRGLGVRFFKTSGRPGPLSPTLGFFVYYNNQGETWAGLDTHLHVVGRLEVHFGLSLVRLQQAHQLDIRKTLGIGFNLL